MLAKLKDQKENILVSVRMFNIITVSLGSPNKCFKIKKQADKDHLFWLYSCFYLK